jgi:hypothetical protein
VGRSTEVITSLALGRGPTDDGWDWLYGLFDHLAPRGTLVRRFACGYFSPSRFEAARSGILYRCLGVPQFGRIIPTGGVTVRRVTGARMAPYTLSGTSVRAARAFYYRACVFEALHLPFFLALFGLSIQRSMIGRLDYALQELAINLVVNLYPMMHHRNTRRRIASLLSRREPAG